MQCAKEDDHDQGLFHDLKIMEAQLKRRQTFALLAGLGTGALLTGCGGGGDSATTSSTSSTSTTSTSTSDSTTSTTTTTSATSSACVENPSETAGPYPADGTNTSSGSTSNVLTVSGIVRSDIRSSFISSTTVATGVKVDITITLVDASNSCSPVSGYAIYFWQCDRQGHYSLYTASTESYLRGVQVTDANGQVTFTTIFPAAYDGRWPHMHFEVYTSLATATSGRSATLTSQFAMPQALASTIYADTTTYPSSATNLAKVSLSTDGIFGDNTTAQNNQMTPTFTAASDGYSAAVTVGL